jgi:hypothetical protein
LFQLFANSVVDPSGKFTAGTAGVVVTGGKFATGAYVVIDTGGKFVHGAIKVKFATYGANSLIENLFNQHCPYSFIDHPHTYSC